MTRAVADAYSATGGAWQDGPGRIYDRLAEVVVGCSPVPLAGGRVLDVGAGTGAATRAALSAGASTVTAVDAAFGMLAHDATHRPPAVVADALAVPFAGSPFDVSVAAFSLSHIPEPAGGLREMARVTRPGGAVIAAAYAEDDVHPVKAAVEAALADRGWVPEAWYEELQSQTAPLMATPEGCRAAAQAAGLDAGVEAVHVPFSELDARQLVEWRLGLAQHAPFVARLDPAEREAVATAAEAALGRPVAPLVRSVLVLSAVRP